MRILYVTERFPYGHGERFIAPEVRWLAEAGHDVRILPESRTGSTADDEQLQDLVLRRVPGAGRPDGKLILRGSPVRWALSASHPRLKYRNCLAVARAAVAASDVKRWDPDHIHCHWANQSATMAAVLAQAIGVSWSLTAHRYDIVVNNLLASKVERATFTRFISASGRGSAETVLGSQVPRAEVIHLGVEVPDAPRPAFENPAVFTIFTPANLVPVKGHRVLLNAAARLIRAGERLDVLFSGAGIEYDRLVRLAEALGIRSSVRFLGVLPQRVIFDRYRTGAVDAVVLPSLVLPGGLQEGIPAALIEAMSYGVPVIGSRSGGVPELLSEGSGIQVGPGDSDALASAIAGLIRSDASVRHEIGQNGHQRVKRHFNIDSIMPRLLEKWLE